MTETLKDEPMKIDFNNVRRVAIGAHDDLVKMLNDAIKPDGTIEINKEVIRRPLEQLRNTLVAIACTYQEDEPDFKCVLDDDKLVAVFDPQPEK